ncbi:MAG: transglycosylase SLT domain-containing protein [Candidatus Marinimicrobia bacterium]|nr:transglycosylase SLT domain-containing protein [Candidatus Neomarinimicrobiota bacterium]
MNHSIRLFLLLLVLSGWIRAQDNFQDFLKANDPDQAVQAYLEEFQNFSAAVTAQYDAWEQQQEEAFLAYKRQVEQQWGDFLGSTNTTWVEYSATLGARTAVDYEHGEVVVETIVEGSSAQAEQNAIERNQEALKQLIAREAKAKGALEEQMAIPGKKGTVKAGESENYAKSTVSKGREVAQKRPDMVRAAKDYDQHLQASFDRDYTRAKVKQTRIRQDEAVANPKAVAAKPPDKAELAQQERAEQQARQRARQTSAKMKQAKPKLEKEGQPVTYTEPIKGKDGKTRTKVTTVIPMVPDHVQRRAEQFRTAVDKEAKRFGIDPALAYAVIHTESFFNPKAKSHIPAYGLMQLVPRSGARDAYQYIYKKDKLLDDDYLYRPDKNVELGCGYLKKIRDVYFRKVKDDETALYMTIAAYNTGVGNVARALTGTTRLSTTADAANSMSSTKTYTTLMKKLPYDETKNYLDKVSERRKLYAGWH